MVTIRHAAAGDASAIVGLWNHIIRDTIITFNPTEKIEAEITEAIVTRPVFLLAEEAGAFLGFATVAQFRGGLGYARTLEHTILLAPPARGQGVGRTLMTALGAAARARGAHVLVAGISGENGPGIAFHQALGFSVTGRMPEVAWKFGRWHTLVLMQKTLEP